MALSLVALPCLCYTEARYQRFLKKWVDDFNNQVGRLPTLMCVLVFVCLRVNGDLVGEFAVASVPTAKRKHTFAQPQVLVPRGMFAKFQTNHISFSYTSGNGASTTYSEDISWLAIALTEEESEILRQEVSFWEPACCSEEIEPHWCQWCFCCCCQRRIV
jgi:hypothetical protein